MLIDIEILQKRHFKVDDRLHVAMSPPAISMSPPAMGRTEGGSQVKDYFMRKRQRTLKKSIRQFALKNSLEQMVIDFNLGIVISELHE